MGLNEKEKFKEGRKMVNNRPIYTIIGGVNGAGKTTLREKNNIDTFIIDIYSMARLEGDFKSAVKIALETMQQYFKVKMSFGQESTLCGKSILNNIYKARKLKYDVILLYVGVENADIAIERVKYRVSQGGHDIPEKDIRRRYDMSLEVVKQNKDLFSSILFFDNSGSKHIHIAMYQNKKLDMLVEGNFSWLNRIFEK